MEKFSEWEMLLIRSRIFFRVSGGVFSRVPRVPRDICVIPFDSVEHYARAFWYILPKSAPDDAIQLSPYFLVLEAW